SPGWWHDSSAGFPLRLQAYLELETEASTVHAFGGEVIPGLAQDSEYARIQEINGGQNHESAEAFAQMRHRRQGRLDSDTNPLHADLVVTEGVLRRCEASGLRSQLEYLRKQSELPTVQLRIMTESAGIHGIAGGYTILELPGHLEPVMYLEHPGGSVLIEDRTAVAKTLQTHLALPALDVDSSAKFLQEFIERQEK
ncbi:MAG: DUF5753 domain-containing protein, partial [Pseudonocardiaceae bacterium]